MARRSEANRGRDERPSGDREERKSRAERKADEVRVPYDPVNEAVIIAAALVDRAARKRLVAAFPVPDFFCAKGHAEIWEVVVELQRRHLDYDPATVQSIAGSRVDVDYVDQLVRDRPAVPPNLKHHVEGLRWDHCRVEAVRGPITALLELVRDPLSDPERVKAAAQSVGGAFRTSATLVRDPVQLVREQRAEIERRRTGIACVAYGIDGLDRYGDGERDEEGHDVSGKWRVMPGAVAGQVTLLTGVSGSGKTTLTTAIALAQADANRRVTFGAWEQGDGPTLELCAVQSCGFSRTRFTVGDVTDDEVERHTLEMERIAERIRFFNIPFGVKRGEKALNDRNIDLIHSYIEETAADVFVADLMRRAFRQFDPDEEEAALYRLQAIAQSTRCHLIMVHQLRMKDLEQRPDKRPTREGVKGSSAWVEVPDTILATHRNALFKNVPNDRVEIICLKQRHGLWPWAVEFDWDGEHGRISNGRGIEYTRPGELGEVDDFIEEAKSIRKKRRRA